MIIVMPMMWMITMARVITSKMTVMVLMMLAIDLLLFVLLIMLKRPVVRNSGCVSVGEGYRTRGKNHSQGCWNLCSISCYSSCCTTICNSSITTVWTCDCSTSFRSTSSRSCLHGHPSLQHPPGQSVFSTSPQVISEGLLSVLPWSSPRMSVLCRLSCRGFSSRWVAG